MNQTGVSDAIMDLAFYAGHDMLKARRIINQDEIVEDAVTAFGYNMIAKEPLMQMQRFIPQVSQPFSDEILKFLGEASIMWVWRWGMAKSRPMGDIFLKQLLAQGSQMVYKQL